MNGKDDWLKYYTTNDRPLVRYQGTGRRTGGYSDYDGDSVSGCGNVVGL